MGGFVFLPLVLPLTAWPIARLAEQHLHPVFTSVGLAAWAAAAVSAMSSASAAVTMFLVLRAATPL
jgi:hypothetical protein